VTTVPGTDTRPGSAPRVAEELTACSGFLLTRLGIGFKALALARADEVGFEPYDYSVLAMLGEGARETQATIADALGRDPSRLVALLDSLEERGLIVRQRDPLDRRRHVVSITEEGKRQLSRLREMSKQLDDEFFAPLDPESRQAFHRMLRQLAGQNDPRCVFQDPLLDQQLS
jgi:DNA-binding MarR family transcriptional regulator